MARQATVGDALIFMTKAALVAVVVIVAPFAYAAWSSKRASIAERQLEATEIQLQATQRQLRLVQSLKRTTMDRVEILSRALDRADVQLTDEEFKAMAGSWDKNWEPPGLEPLPEAEELARRQAVETLPPSFVIDEAPPPRNLLRELDVVSEQVVQA
jgi:hypothetical protein